MSTASDSKWRNDGVRIVGSSQLDANTGRVSVANLKLNLILNPGFEPRVFHE